MFRWMGKLEAKGLRRWWAVDIERTLYTDGGLGQ